MSSPLVFYFLAVSTISPPNDAIKEPPRPPTPEPKMVTYRRESSTGRTEWSKIDLSLVGSHPLWAHYLCVIHAIFPDQGHKLNVLRQMECISGFRLIPRSA